MTKKLTLFFALLAGSLLPLAFAPLGIWPLAIISPALLLFFWEKASPKEAFLLGLFYGFGLFGIGISWVFVSIHVYGHTPILFAVFLTSLLVLILSSYLALLGLFLKKYFKGTFLTFCLLGFPCSWVLFEWIRGWLFTGFPWLLLGNSQIDSPLGSFAPIGGVYLVSFIVAVLSGSLLLFIKGDSKNKWIAASLFIVFFGLGFLLQKVEYTTPMDSKKTVSLIQGNLDPDQKFGKNALLAIDEIYGKLTAAEWGRNLILWPEAAIPIPLPYATAYLEKLDALAKKNASTLITGIQVNLPNEVYHNALLALGVGQGIYYKQHLVPFGDFLPFERWLRGIVGFFDLPNSSFTSGPANQNPINLDSVILTPLICYEIAFPELVRLDVQKTNAIVILSEDGWFGGSFGPHQHLEISRMRALETGRPVVRATTRGISAIINEKGKIIEKTELFQKTVLRGEFQPMQGFTPWIRIGEIPWMILFLIGFLAPRWHFAARAGNHAMRDSAFLENK